MPFFFPRQASLAQEQEEQLDLFTLLSILAAASEEDSPSQPQQPKAQPQQQQQQQQQQQYQRCFSQCAPRRQQTPTINPAFDILETESSYELFGEVPGLDIKSLEVRFEDAQTLVLKGLTQRGRLTAPKPAAAVKVQEPEVVKEAEIEVKEDIKGKQPSVSDVEEEEYDSVDTPLSASTITTEKATPAPTVEAAKPVVAAKPAEVKKQQTIRAKYWLQERKIGQFARSFSFAQRIEIDDVTAELKEGVLHVVVPKSVKSKKVEVVVV